MFTQVFRSIYMRYQWLKFVWKNYLIARRFSGFSCSTNGDMLLRAFQRHDLAVLDVIYRTYNGGRRLATRFRWLLILSGHAQCIVVEHPVGSIVGFSLYYFNERDIAERTVHEGFIAVTERHCGFGSALREKSLNYFEKRGIGGVSTRISKSNRASLQSAKMLGFQVMEEYYDEGLAEERVYMIKRFDGVTREPS